MSEGSPSGQDLNHESIPRPRRALSHFLAREMLYDFMMGRLDADRFQAMQDFLKNNPELKTELDAMRRAEQYLENLAETRITKKHLDELVKIRSRVVTYLARFSFGNWPEIVKWSSEALLISFAVAALGLFVPWDKVGYSLKYQVGPRIAEVFTLDYLDTNNSGSPQRPTLNGSDDEKSVSEMELAQNDSGESSESNSTIGETPTSSEDSKNLNASGTTAGQSVDKQQAIATNMNTSSAASGEATNKTKSGETDSSELKSDTAAKDKRPAKKEPELRGFVYSMMMSLTNTAKLTPEIRERIQGFGGVKAGQVELGWRKSNPPGSYFHFSMPESNYGQLTQTLGQYGRVRIYKNPHERVMPEGQIRIILWIEDNMVDKQDEENAEP